MPTIGDHSGIGPSTGSSLPAMDPEPEIAGGGEPDLEAIAKDLAEVEAELDRLADGTYGDGRTPPGPAAP
jgi:hypothetical protein